MKEVKTKFFTYCPDCGTSKQVVAYNQLLDAANKHNAGCEKRLKFDLVLRKHKKGQ